MNAGIMFQTGGALRWRRPAGHLVALILLVGMLGGCMDGLSYNRQVPWGYVLDMGSARTITEWTLKQQDPEKINHGRAALGDTTVLEGVSAADRADGVAGYLQVHRKVMEGWPGIMAWERWNADPSEARQKLLEISRLSVRGRLRLKRDNKWARQLFEELVRLDPEMPKDDPRVGRRMFRPGPAQPGPSPEVVEPMAPRPGAGEAGGGGR